VCHAASLTHRARCGGGGVPMDVQADGLGSCPASRSPICVRGGRAPSHVASVPITAVARSEVAQSAPAGRGGAGASRPVVDMRPDRARPSMPADLSTAGLVAAPVLPVSAHPPALSALPVSPSRPIVPIMASDHDDDRFDVNSPHHPRSRAAHESLLVRDIWLLLLFSAVVL
jgi:hypothetical protein